MLCMFCKQISPRTQRMYHHARFSELVESAKSCPICKILLDLFDPATRDQLEKTVYESNYAKVLLVGNSRSTLDGSPTQDEFPAMVVEVATRTKYYISRKFVLNFDGHIYSDRAIWKNTQAISFEQSIPILKGWYEECTSQHAGCSSLAKPLPTRLLSIGPDADSNPRLVKTVGQVGIYAALSHCWGKAQDTIRTTTALLGEFSTSIELTRFPKTFRDAITVTRLLGIEYLWIDSLCIVQDDEEDWQKESARMSSVFTNTNLTVAATASEDSHGGCLFDREPAVHVLVANKEEEAADADAGSSCYVRYPAEEATSLRSSPLYQRGWVLQEMVLSRRTVHFARDQLFWHCCSRITSEDGYFDASLGSTYFDLENPAKAHQSWWTCVEDYSNRKLTKESDKFAALAGLIKAFPLDAKPIAGLWEDDIHFGLLWCTRGPATRCGMDGIPTWSWASVNSPVRALVARDSPIWSDHSKNVTKQMQLLESSIEWSGEPLTSSILKAKLTVRARVALAVVAGEGEQEQFTHGLDPLYKGLNYHRFVKLFRLVPHATDYDSISKDCEGHCCFDLASPQIGSRVLCLLVSTATHCGTCKQLKKKAKGRGDEDFEYNPKCMHRMHNILIIEGTGQVADEFTRIGVGTITPNDNGGDFFTDSEEMDITLR